MQIFIVVKWLGMNWMIFITVLMGIIIFIMVMRILVLKCFCHYNNIAKKKVQKLNFLNAKIYLFIHSWLWFT